LPVNDTEADRLIEQVKAPARFADYRPRFRVQEEKYLDATSISRHEYTEQVCYAIFDGDRRIGSMKQWAGGVDVSFTNMNPREPWNGPEEESGKQARRYCRLLMGVPFQIPGMAANARWMFAVAPDGQSINTHLTHTPQGEHKDAWKLRRMRATLRMDGRCGYVLDAIAEFASDKTPPYLWTPRKDAAGRTIAAGAFEGYEYCNVLPSHVIHFVTYGPYLWRYERTLYTPRDSDKYIGWINDTSQASASDSVGLPMRKDGFICFSADRRGWSQVLSHNSPDDVLFDNATCWKLQDQHNMMRTGRPTGEGPYQMRLMFRFMNLPPEGTRHLLDRIEMMNFGVPAVAVRQGKVQDFESDRRDPQTASPWTKEVQIADGQAHSGTKSAVLRPVKGGRGGGDCRIRIDPLPVLEANATYRLEAWVKVQGAGSKAWLAVDGPHWTPRPWDKPPIQPAESTAAEASDRWQKLDIAFTTPETHGRTPPLFVKAKLGGADGAVYVDDVHLTRVEKQR
jgi:hypothetical protein